MSFLWTNASLALTDGITRRLRANASGKINLKLINCNQTAILARMISSGLRMITIGRQKTEAAVCGGINK
jgi:hypothetical protein